MSNARKQAAVGERPDPIQPAAPWDWPAYRRIAGAVRDLDRGAIFPLPALLALFLLLASTARADGGHLALHRTEGPYTLTLFTAPNPLLPGRGDLSVLVEDAEGGAVLEDATVEARLSASGQAPQRIPLTHGAASNRLLLAGSPIFKASGSYQVELRVSRPSVPAAAFHVVLVVEPDRRRRNVLLLALILPMGVVGVFLLNQHAKRLGALRRVRLR